MKAYSDITIGFFIYADFGLNSINLAFINTVTFGSTAFEIRRSPY